MLRLVCRFCEGEVVKIMVSVFYLNSNTLRVIWSGGYSCDCCGRTMRRPLFKSLSGNGNRKMDYKPGSNGVDGFGRGEGLVDFHALARDRKKLRFLRATGEPTFKELWTSQRSRPPQKPLSKTPRYPMKGDMVREQVHLYDYFLQMGF